MTFWLQSPRAYPRHCAAASPLASVSSGVQNKSVRAVMIDMGCRAGDPMTAHLGVPRPGR
jgi:hypothetical protein